MKNKRLVFVPLDYEPYYSVETVNIPDEFKLETSQQKKDCLKYIHEVFHSKHPTKRILEISTKSFQPEGVALSAFNLSYFVVSEGENFPVENVYQSSKFFENGKNYRDLLYVTPKEAKKDVRLTSSGKVIKYIFESYEYPFDEIEYPVEPKDAFFNYLYMLALMKNSELSNMLFRYDAFSDIEFDPAVGVNCQARVAAKYVGMVNSGIIKSVSDVCDIIDCCIKKQI